MCVLRLAQLVERSTVAVSQISNCRWFDSGSGDFLTPTPNYILGTLLMRIFVFLFFILVRFLLHWYKSNIGYSREQLFTVAVSALCVGMGIQRYINVVFLGLRRVIAL